MTIISTINNLIDAIDGRISDFITSHNTSNSAHDNILSTVAKTGSFNDLTDKPNGFTVDSSLSTTSTNPVQNDVLTNALDNKAETEHNHDNRYYTESEINTKLDDKANSTHSHTWTSQSISSYGTLRINPDIRLCILQYSREVSFPTANSTKTVASGAIPSRYRPSGGIIIGSTYNPAVAMGVNKDGDILMKASSATTSAVDIKCTTIWNY